MNELQQAKTDLDNMAEIKASITRLVDENARLKMDVQRYKHDRNARTDLLESLVVDKLELCRIVGQIGQAVVDKRLSGVGAWYRDLRKLAE